MLLGAFIAGNVLAQLDSGVKRNDSYSGMIQVFRVYRHLKAEEPAYNVPEIEDLLALHRRGELAPHLAKLEAEEEKEARDAAPAAPPTDR